jgi:pimeloyl-ACP methyl ester carboxylesterase
MPAVLVHGVPDTHRLWEPLRSHLQRSDVVAVSLPGFDAPVPPGFDATKEAYVEWLIAELERGGAPVDLVGHDWGALLVQRVEGCGHWWPLERPAEVAAVLERLWKF